MQADRLNHSLQLCKELNDQALMGEIVDQARRALSAALSKPEAMPGDVINLLEALMASPSPPAELDDLLDRAIERLGDDPWASSFLVEMQIARTSDPEERKSAFGKFVTRWREVAVKAEGITRAVFLNTALEGSLL